MLSVDAGKDAYQVGNGQGTSSSGTSTTASSNRGNRGEYRASTYRVPTHVQEARDGTGWHGAGDSRVDMGPIRRTSKFQPFV